MNAIQTAKDIQPMPVMGQAIPSQDRLVSLDAYRGFVILMMTFVNFIGEGMDGVPHWLKHATVSEDLFTFPDLVFPGFLFMVGLAIPLAFSKKINGPWLPSFKKIVIRTLGLLAVGVLYENGYRYDESIALLPKSLFITLFYSSVLVIWFQGEKKKIGKTGAALVVLVALMFLYRGQKIDGFQTVYLEHTWWGILGLIGWGYLLCSTIFLVSKGSGTALMGTMAMMLVLYMGEAAGLLEFIPKFIREFVGIGAVFGSTAANVMAGVIAGRWFIPDHVNRALAADGQGEIHIRRIGWMLTFAICMILAGYLLRPFHHISKIGATESYTLISAGINLLGFMVFYLLLDVFKWRTWATLLIPAGTNALLAYILPDYWEKVMHLFGLGKVWLALGWPYLERGGIAGILNASVVSVFMLFITHVLTRLGLRLKF
jgi:heparan-alpha-glucosaminide N-acetyltransferase